MARHNAFYGSPRWRSLRLLILDRDGWRCRTCGSSRSLEVDHIIGIHDGGDAYKPGNLQTLCKSCHSAKTASEGRPIPERVRAWRAFAAQLRKPG